MSTPRLSFRAANEMKGSLKNKDSTKRHRLDPETSPESVRRGVQHSRIRGQAIARDRACPHTILLCLTPNALLNEVM